MHQLAWGLSNTFGITAWMSDDVALHYIVLWAFVFGSALIGAVWHLKRSAQLRRLTQVNEHLEGRLRNLLQHSREILFGINLQTGQFDYLSPACLNLTGYTVEEIKERGPRGMMRRLHEDDRDKISRLIEQLRTSRAEREWLGLLDYRFCHRDGQYVHFSDHVHVNYNAEGEAVYLSGTARDVSTVVQMEENLEVLDKKLQDTQTMAGLGLLASGIAHDFNNLMTVVLCNAELALLESGETDKDALNEIKKIALRAADLATQMMVYTGKKNPVREGVDFASVVKEMGSLLDVSISKKVTLEYSLAENLAYIRGDVSQIRQVVMNLITNAAQAIGDRSGVIAISVHEVVLGNGELKETVPPGGLPAGRYVRLEVSDTGDGMSEETRQKIFDPLFTTKTTGRGLGLALLLNVVRQHQGAVVVESEPGRGTVFRVYFPVDAEENESDSIEGVFEDDEWRGCGTALVADDEQAIRAVASALLEHFGFRAIVASDGLEMIDLYSEHAEETTVLLMDMHMPRLNGIETVQRIRHINPNLPVLFMSGYSRDRVMEPFKNYSRIDFVKKPFQMEELRAGIRRVMEDVPMIDEIVE